MKILTLNINSIRAHAESFLDILRRGEYDTILVQELKVETANFPHMLFDEFGYNIKVFGQKSWNGVAVFSKYSIEDVTMGMPNYADPHARFIECVIDGRVRVINTYMPNGDTVDSPKFPYKLEWMRAFTDYIAQYTNSIEPVIIAGDFNVAIEDRDIWKPKNYEGIAISAPARPIVLMTNRTFFMEHIFFLSLFTYRFCHSFGPPDLVSGLTRQTGQIIVHFYMLLI